MPDLTEVILIELEKSQGEAYSQIAGAKNFPGKAPREGMVKAGKKGADSPKQE